MGADTQTRLMQQRRNAATHHTMLLLCLRCWGTATVSGHHALTILQSLIQPHPTSPFSLTRSTFVLSPLVLTPSLHVSVLTCVLLFLLLPLPPLTLPTYLHSSLPPSLYNSPHSPSIVSVEPQLNVNHETHRINTPSAAFSML